VRSRAAVSSAFGAVFSPSFPSGSLARSRFRRTRLQPLVEVQAALPRRLHEQQRTRCDARGEDGLDAVLGSSQQRAQRLVQRGLGDTEALGLDHVLEVVQQHDDGPGRAGLEQGEHQRPRALMRIAIALFQLLGDVRWQQPAQVGEQVREADRMRPHGAEVDDAVNRGRAELTGQLPALQRLQQAAHHGGLAHPAAAGHGHHAKPVIAQEVGDQSGFHIPVLKPGGRHHRRWVHELGPADPDRALRLSFAFEAGRDVLRGLLPRRVGVVDEAPLLVDPPV
jgi:hypothetical protein